MDMDFVNMRDMKMLFIQCRYHEFKTMYCLNPKYCYLEIGLMSLEKDNDVNDTVIVPLEFKIVNEFGDYKMHIYFEHLVLDVEDTEFVSDSSLVEDSIVKTPPTIEDDNDFEMLSVPEEDVPEENVFKGHIVEDLLHYGQLWDYLEDVHTTNNGSNVAIWHPRNISHTRSVCDSKKKIFKVLVIKNHKKD